MATISNGDVVNLLEGNIDTTMKNTETVIDVSKEARPCRSSSG
jgi:hypothetical protein